jgi:hypothetical protein
LLCEELVLGSAGALIDLFPNVERKNFRGERLAQKHGLDDREVPRDRPG